MNYLKYNGHAKYIKNILRTKYNISNKFCTTIKQYPTTASKKQSWKTNSKEQTAKSKEFKLKFDLKTQFADNVHRRESRRELDVTFEKKLF